jgi:hypothetical protein
LGIERSVGDSGDGGHGCCGVYAPLNERQRRLLRTTGREGNRASFDEGVPSRGRERGRREQIGLQTACNHFCQKDFRIGCEADRDGPAAAELILENAKRLIEVAHDEIAESRPHALAEKFRIGFDAE